jgi:Replication factor RFC1 C terminal domain
MQTMHDYCMARDDLDYLLDVTKFKTKGAWNDDPLKGVPTALKSAFTRYVCSFVTTPGCLLLLPPTSYCASWLLRFASRLLRQPPPRPASHVP